MSDQDSESSCEWILMSEDDGTHMEDNDADDEDQFALKPNFEGGSLVVSDSMSSLSGEELEWQYDPMELNYLSPYGASTIEEIDRPDENVAFDPTCDIDDALGICDHQNCLNDELLLNLHSGWSHKCWTQVIEVQDCSDQNPNANPTDMKQIVASLDAILNGLTKRQNSEKLQNPSLSSVKTLDTWTAAVNNNVIQDHSIQNISKDKNFSAHEKHMVIENSSDVDVEISLDNDYVLLVEQNDILYIPNTLSNNSPEIDNEFHDSDSKAYGCSTKNSQTVGESFLDHDTKFKKEFESKSVFSKKVNLNDQGILNVDDNRDQRVESELLSLESKMFNEFKEGIKGSSKLNFAHPLQDDLVEIIQALKLFSISQISADNSEGLAQMERFYSELQDIIVDKIGFIQNFVENEEFKVFPKHNIKHLKRMVYSLIDTLEAVLQRCRKMVRKGDKRLNLSKFSKGMSKIIDNFNKSWVRHHTTWSQDLLRARQRKLQHGKFQDSKKKRSHYKGNRDWKKGMYSDKKFSQKRSKRSFRC